MPRWMWVVVAALVVWFVASPSESDERPRRTAPQVETTPDRPDAVPASEGGRTGTRSDGKQDGEPVDRPRDHRTPEMHERTWLVVEVIDGDTVDLGNGERVRLVGIDTPERGECGYEKAADALSELVLGRQVVLAPSDEDRDQYDRLLRYVDVGGVDAGLTLVRHGLAIARYDSRDGYGFHPREPKYVAADRGSKPVGPTRPVGFAGTGQQGGQQNGCAPGYSPCVPVYPPDVDCADVNGPVAVSGTDPHGLDADGDGTACE
ncbi:thermonuclease family protein [Nocardioides sp.]|uniref:thermonuclease family protein n=1 Tax=Nocardioides sp. TaxID=35761 RepID=UPI002ED58915